MTAEVGARSELAYLNGLRFHYLDWGNDGARPLVLLHGLSSNAHQWDGFGPAMRERYHVLALDQRGHGQSDWAEDYRPERMVEDIDAFVRALGLRPFALLGLSMGGRNAYLYAAAHPEEVERLVIVDIGPELVPAGAARIRTGMQSRDVFDDPEAAFRAARAANPRPTDAYLRHRIRHGLMRLQDGRWTWRYDKSLRSPGGTLPRPDPAVAWSSLSKIACPTLIVRGAESDVFSRETAERMRGLIKDCRFVEVPDSGHPVPGDNPDGFLAAVRDFLQA